MYVKNYPMLLIFAIKNINVFKMQSDAKYKVKQKYLNHD